MSKRKLVDNIFLISGTAVVGVKYQFMPDPEINNARIAGLIWYTQTALDSGFKFGFPNYTPITNGNSKVAFVSLCNKNGRELHKDIPLYTLAPDKNNGIIREFFNNDDIDLTRSYVRFGDTATPITNSFILFTFVTYPKN